MSRTISDHDPARVFLLGDVHGNGAFAEYAIAAAGRAGCGVVLQLGDFGYWDHTLGGRSFLDRVARAAATCDTTVYFIDGNHENHDLLDDLVESGRVGADGVAWVRPNVGWITRGTRWEWRGTTFAALGGAASVDRERRETGWTWWPQETLHPRDLATLGRDPVDVLISHDAPALADLHGLHPLPAEILRSCAESRQVLDDAVATVRPQLVIHGHWHRRHTTVAGAVRIEGFGADNGPFETACAVLHPDTLRIDAVDTAGTVLSADHTH